MAVSTAPELVILDPDGDAILKVGENPTNQSKDRDEGSSCALQIRISTKLLAMSSPVFKAMLDGRFAEGQLPFSKENPPSVVLPEDDPDAVLNYCKIIHHAQDAQFPVSFGPLCNIAVLSEKYACNQALSGWFRAQLSECFTPEGVILTNSALAKGGLTISGVIGLSYLFGDARIFYRAASNFLRHVPRNDTRELLAQTPGERLPEILIDIFEKYQSMAMGKMSSIGQNVVESLIKERSQSRNIPWAKILVRDGEKYTDRYECTGTIKRTGGCISSLCNMGLWPISGQELGRSSVQDIADRLLRLAEAGLNDGDRTCEFSKSCPACKFDIGGAIKQKVNQVQQNLIGICLRCLKMAEADSEDCDLMVKCLKHDVEL